jgi:hypothetical protein
MYYFTTSEITIRMQIFATAAISFGITINMLLVLGAFSELSVGWIEPMKSISHILSFLTFRIEVLNPGCVFGVNSPVLTYLGGLLVFPCFVVGMLASFGMSTLLGRSVDRCRIYNSIGLVLLLFYLSLVIAAILPWQCKNNPDGSSSWSSQKAVLCWDSSDHSTVIAFSVFAILVYIVSFIALVVWATFRYPSWVLREGGLSWLRAFFWLFSRFTPECYYYGLIYTLRNLVLAIVPVSLVNEPGAQMMTLSLVIMGTIVLQCWLKPWRSTTGNILDV